MLSSTTWLRFTIHIFSFNLRSHACWIGMCGCMHYILLARQAGVALQSALGACARKPELLACKRYVLARLRGVSRQRIIMQIQCIKNINHVSGVQCPCVPRIMQKPASCGHMLCTCAASTSYDASLHCRSNCSVVRLQFLYHLSRRHCITKAS